MGYTYTTGRNGGAITDILRREVPDFVAGRDADLIEAVWTQGMVGAALWRSWRSERARALGV